MTKTELELVKRFKAKLEDRLHLRALIVFGSRARGDAEGESDLDVLVVTEEPETDEVLEYVSGCAFETDLGSDVIISATVVSRAEWEGGLERFSLLSLAVKRDGIPV